MVHLRFEDWRRTTGAVPDGAAVVVGGGLGGRGKVKGSFPNETVEHETRYPL
jgi:hypothetical protein